MHCAPHAHALAVCAAYGIRAEKAMRNTRAARIQRMRYGLISAPQRAAAVPDGAQCARAQNAHQMGANGAKCGVYGSAERYCAQVGQIVRRR